MSPDLYTRLFERSVFPLLDLANGTTIAAKLAALLQSEHEDRAEIFRRQEALAARVVEGARRDSDFYRERWQRGGGRAAPGPSSRFAALDGLPTVSKAELAAAAGAFPLATHRGKVISCRTSGSTGSPMVFHRSLEQESWFWALRFRIWRWAGYHPGDSYLTINLNPRLGWRKQLQDRLFRCAYLTFNADNQDSRRILERLERDRIRHLNGFASSLYVLARHMLEHGVKNPGVVGITSTGDGLFPAYRETLETAFGVRVLDYYGAGGEGVHLASQCPESGGRYHLHPENAIFELITGSRSGGERPAAPGESGRIVVTQLHNGAMPLVRYELEDVAVAAPEDATCACGRTLPLLERIEGRVPDLVAVPDGSFLVMHFFVVLFKNLQSIYRYQVVQREAGKLVVRLVARAGCRQGEVEASVRREVARATRDGLEVAFEWIDDIPLSGAGKRRLVISDLSRQLLGRPASEPAAH